jgi:hypothetical protein
MLHLELQPELEARLAAQAQLRGLSVERYLEILVKEHDQNARPPDTDKVKRAIARLLELREASPLNGLSILDLVREGRKY